MPTKHIVKQYRAPAFYHVYNRASGERKLFRDSDDREFFLTLLQEHLLSSEAPEKGRDYPKFDVEIVAYCLMGTHFHLLLYQESDEQAMQGYMKSVSTRYSMYYNKKYRSKGHVFQSHYRASWIFNEAYLAHITRYIHLNPQRYDRYKWSSYQQYIELSDDGWVRSDLAGEMRPEQYKRFVQEFSSKDMREIASELSFSISAIFFKIGSSEVVKLHQIETKVGIVAHWGDFFFGFAEQKPDVFRGGRNFWGSRWLHLFGF